MTSPDRVRKRFPEISSRAYEHPADRSALVAMRSLTGFDVLLKRLSGLFNERSFRLMYLASAVRTSDQQFRRLHEMLRDCCAVLDLPEVPELYVVQSPVIQAMALGSDRPFLVISTGAINLYDDEELRFVIGHEVGHVLSGHAVYRTMLLHLTRLATRVAFIPLGYLGLRAIIVALEEWYRKSELSCDRAGLLCGQDPEAARRAMMKLAGGTSLAEMSTEEFLNQAREYDRAGDVRDGLLKLLMLQGNTHPFAVVRFAEITKWIQGGEYEQILAGTYPRREDDHNASVTEEIRAAAKSYRDSWNETADPFIGVVRDVAGTAARAGESIFRTFTRRGGSE